MRQETVAVGLSGGVDSLMTVLKLQQEGFRVIGVHLVLWKEQDLSELRALCSRLGIELLCCDGRDVFYREVVEPFLTGYSAGRTPNPCTGCNGRVKWELLMQTAERAGIEKIATGHYVRIRPEGTHSYLLKGIDPMKDQSYFLWEVEEKILQRAYTPLGEYSKAGVKEEAEKAGFATLAFRRESMGICFLEGKDYREFMLRHLGEKSQPVPGEIRDRKGRVLGQHSGLLHYTVGQKRGLPLLGDQPAYVAQIDAENNCLVVDRKEGLYCRTFYLERMHLIDAGEWKAADIEVKIRGLGLNPSGFVRIHPFSADKWRVTLSSPAWAVASGQPVAFYRGDRLIGGGIVTL